MTVPGGRKHNARGRSTGQFYIKRHQKISGQFIAHRVDMLRSPAWRALSFTARRILDRLEIEHAGHGGAENGNLICTYDDFERFGVRRASVSRGLHEAVALGFLKITHQGRMAAADFYTSSKYRLTYLNTKSGGPTDEWEKIIDETVAQKNKNPDSKARSEPNAKTSPIHTKSGLKSAPPILDAETRLLSISRGDGPEPDTWQPLAALVRPIARAPAGSAASNRDWIDLRGASHSRVLK